MSAVLSRTNNPSSESGKNSRVPVSSAFINSTRSRLTAVMVPSLEVSLAKRISASPFYAARRGGVRSLLFLPAAAISAPALRSSQVGHPPLGWLGLQREHPPPFVMRLRKNSLQFQNRPMIYLRAGN